MEELFIVYTIWWWCSSINNKSTRLVSFLRIYFLFQIKIELEHHYGGSYGGGAVPSINRREIIEHFADFRRAIHEGPVSLVQRFYNTK